MAGEGKLSDEPTEGFPYLLAGLGESKCLPPPGSFFIYSIEANLPYGKLPIPSNKSSSTFINSMPNAFGYSPVIDVK